MDTSHKDLDRLLTPAELPEHFEFDFVAHEYWKLGRAYQELCTWKQELEDWEHDLQFRENAFHNRRRRNRRGGYRGRQQQYQTEDPS